MHSPAYKTQEVLPLSHNNIQQHYPAQTGWIQHGLVPVSLQLGIHAMALNRH